MPSGSGANANGTRELTAEQLAGPATPGTSTPGTTTTTTTTNARPRRARRNRRTPSQISTRSLPAYMKEPGEQELVIYRYVFFLFISPRFFSCTFFRMRLYRFAMYGDLTTFSFHLRSTLYLTTTNSHFRPLPLPSSASRIS